MSPPLSPRPSTALAKTTFIAGDSESSGQLFGRIKGRTEKDLTELLGDDAYHFRPPFIHPIVKRPTERAKVFEKIGDALA